MFVLLVKWIAHPKIKITSLQMYSSAEHKRRYG